MEVRINITEGFEKDLKKLTSQEQSIVKKKLNHLIELIRSGNSISNHLYRLHKIHLIENLESSLYIFKVNKDIRIILTSENDPLFEEHLLTLLKVVRHQNLEKSFKSISQSIYQSLIHKEEHNG